MVHLPNTHIERGFVFMMPQKPVLLPEYNGGSLASIFGMVLPPITTEANYPIEFDKAQTVINELKADFNSKIVDTGSAKFYVSGKTDYVDEKSEITNSVNPGYHIIDHSKFDKISGLYTIVTGKMTLAFHSSKDVAQLILGSDVELRIDQSNKVMPDPKMLALEPWNDFSKI